MIVAVIGLGTFGAKTALRLSEKGADVLAIDQNHELVEKIKDRVTQAVCLDVTDERSLRSMNIAEVDVAIVAMGDNVEISILAVAMLRKLGVGRVVARATTPLHEHVLKEIGASEIIKVEEEMGEIVAAKLVAPHLLQRYNFALGYALVELKLGKKFSGKTIAELQMRQSYSLNVVALKRKVPYITEEGRSAFRMKVNDNPLPMDIVETDDVAVLVGSETNFNRLFADLSEE